MKINIKATNIELNDSLRFFVQEKIGELEKFLGVFGPEDLNTGEKEKIQFWVEIGKTTKHHLKGDVFRAEVQLYLPKKSLRAEATNIDLRTAIVEVKDELQREIKRHKEKRLGRARKWARMTKEKFRTPSILKRK
ncbi:MAG: ribosome-associated translation inhibitor RaiA [Patescibacteria group bacterium]|nr:ribosome-associated translation inhibitor RaiA [Patescibacteria group bacterium]